MTAIENVSIGMNSIPKYSLLQAAIRSGKVEQINRETIDQAYYYLDLLGIAGYKDNLAGSLPYGLQRRLEIARAIATKPELLLLDEPASPLDPLMRDKLCQMIGEYIHEGNGKRSVFFSTHNISDMENITDYAIIMENGQIVEQGFVEDLKEKYILIKGDAADTEAAGKVLYSMTKNPYGFEGICLAENIDKLAGLNVTKEIPTLYQISVAVMKNNTKIVMR